MQLTKKKALLSVLLFAAALALLFYILDANVARQEPLQGQLAEKGVGTEPAIAASADGRVINGHAHAGSALESNSQGFTLALSRPKPPSHPKIAALILRTLEDLESQGITPDTAEQTGFAGITTPFVRVDANARLQVYITTTSLNDNVYVALREQAVEVEIANEGLSIIQGWIPVDHIEAVASLPFVTKVKLPNYGQVQTGSVDTEGDSILRASELRQLGIFGAGIRVGIISDGANSLSVSQASGDLPNNVSVYGACSTRAANYTSCLSARTCNEGTAMAEIIHDIAPAAEIAIAAVNTGLEFIQQANALAGNFQAHIIVDDLGFFGEPYFSDGPIAQAVATLANRVVFVSAAGNAARGHYEADYRLTIVDDVDLHDFGRTDGGVTDYTMDVVINPGEFLLPILQWNDRFGQSANDYDLFLVNAANQLLCPNCSSELVQFGFHDPIEGFCAYNNTPSAVSGQFVVKRYAGANRRLEMFLLGLGQSPEYNKPAGSIFGHAGVNGVLAAGAINANEPGNDAIAVYSSRGPSRIDFPSFAIRQKPDVIGIDGVSVTGAGGFPSTFYGTSAAAPHVAGVAALLLSIPGATRASVTTALVSGATDLGAAGFDATYGYGRVDALAALTQLDSDADGVATPGDNCPNIANSNQLDFDNDGDGNACDTDDDNDGTPDTTDPFPLDPNEWVDTDRDGIGNNADLDDDGDGLSDADEINVHGTNPLRRDTDGDGLNDGDEIANGLDPLEPGDCPEELCPTPNSLIKLIPLIIDKEDD